jgi:S1-C subfamily serine protease
MLFNKLELSKHGIVKVIRHDGGSGTAFLVSKTLLVSAAHVVGQYETVEISIGDKMCESSVLYKELTHDLAILKATDLPEILQPVTIGQSTALEMGEDLLIAGYPLGSNMLTVHHGFLSAKGTANDFPAGRLGGLDISCPLLQIDGTINEGFSGGPVFQVSTNQVCGFITTKYGLLKDFSDLRKSLGELLQNPVIKQFESSGGGVIISGVDFGRFTNFLLQSLAIVSRSLQVVHVGIGYSVAIEVLKPLISKFS